MKKSFTPLILSAAISALSLFTLKSHSQVMVKDINTSTMGSGPENLINVNGTLFFMANDGINGFDLWKSDGTTSGTAMLKDILSGTSGSTPDFLTDVNGALFFTANDGYAGQELWKYGTITANISDYNYSGIGLIVFPNPFSNSTTLVIPDEIKNSTLIIYDVIGNEIFKSPCSDNQLQIERGNLSNGIYFLQLRNENNIIATQKNYHSINQL